MIKSDGGSTAYYEILIPLDKVAMVPDYDGPPSHALIEVKDVIRYALDNDFDKGNIFKALVRLGEKDGASIEYDINKCIYFLEELRKDLV